MPTIQTIFRFSKLTLYHPLHSQSPIPPQPAAAIFKAGNDDQRVLHVNKFFSHHTRDCIQ